MKNTRILIFTLLSSILFACGEKNQTKKEMDKQQVTYHINDSVPARRLLGAPPPPPLPDTISYAEMFDTIEADSIAVGDNKGNIYNGGSEELFLTAFGPAKGKRFYSEMVEQTRIYYELDGLHAEFDTTQMNWDLGVTKPTFKYKLGSHWYKPGDPITRLAKQFPKSYKSREDNRIYIVMSLRGVPLDGCVAIFYDEKGLITWLTSGANES